MRSQDQIYKDVTDKIVKLLEEGTVPWSKPWNPSTETPVNFASKKPYRGVNIWLLKYSEFESRFWATFKQIQKLGGKIKKGSKATTIVYWNFKRYVGEDKNGDEKVTTLPFLKEYKVFNLEQTVGIEIPKNDSMKLEFENIDSAEEIVNSMPDRPSIKHEDQDRACYSPTFDIVMMPKKKQFKTEEHYYATLFHELSHSTGHENRLSRPEVTQANMFGSHSYSKEELVAEFSSAYLCAVAGINKEELENQTAAYIESWSKKLKENPKWLVSACGKASKSANFILGIKAEEEVSRGE